MARWLHAPQQFQFSIVHWPGRDHGNADGLFESSHVTVQTMYSPGLPMADVVTESID